MAHERATRISGPYTAQLAMAWVSFIVAMIELPILKRIAKIHEGGSIQPVIGWSLISILCGIFGTTTYHEAFTRLPGTKVIPLTSSYPLIAIAISYLGYGSPVTQNTLIGAILIVLGCSFISQT